MPFVCRKCCQSVASLSPAGNCRACIERSLAENPRMLVAVDFVARQLERHAGADTAHDLRSMVAVRVALGFLERCRK